MPGAHLHAPPVEPRSYSKMPLAACVRIGAVRYSTSVMAPAPCRASPGGLTARHPTGLTRAPCRAPLPCRCARTGSGTGSPGGLDEPARPGAGSTLGLVGVLLLPVPACSAMLGHRGSAGPPGRPSARQIAPWRVRRHWPVAVFALVAVVQRCSRRCVIDDAGVGPGRVPGRGLLGGRFSRALPRLAGALAIGICGALVASVRLAAGFDQAAPPRRSRLRHVLFISAVVATAVGAPGTLGRTGRAGYVAALVERGEQIRRARPPSRSSSPPRRTSGRGSPARCTTMVAHELSTIVVQADGARYAAAQDPEPRRARDSGRSPRPAARPHRDAADAGPAPRRTTAAPRPQPRLADLAGARGRTATAGEDVEATTAAPAPRRWLAAGVELTAYRVVQEALTNVRKHAGPGRARDVVVDVDAGSIEVVEDDERRRRLPSGGRGLGLVGMRRAGGRPRRHAVRPDPGRAAAGFRVAARLPGLERRADPRLPRRRPADGPRGASRCSSTASPTCRWSARRATAPGGRSSLAVTLPPTSS